MTREACDREGNGVMSRRTLIKAMGVVGGVAAVAPRGALAQAPPAGPAAPPSTVTSPPRDFSASGAPTTYFTDPDILSVEPLFNSRLKP